MLLFAREVICLILGKPFSVVSMMFELKPHFFRKAVLLFHDGQQISCYIEMPGRRMTQAGTAEAESWLKILLTVLYKLIQTIIIQLQLTTKLALALARLMLCA